MAQLTPVRDPAHDALLSPSNSVIAFIDYQPEQFDGVGSRERDELLLNVTTLGRIAHDFGIPTVLSTVGVVMGVNRPTVAELKRWLPETKEIDRTTLNSWEDEEFVSAVRGSRRRKLILAGLWTEVCVAFPALDALKAGFEVYFVVDAIGGMTSEIHLAAVERMIQAGARPITTLALACEFQRDWARGHGDTLRTIMRGYFEAREGLGSKAAA